MILVFREAAEHLLSALNQQAKGTTSRGEKGGMSDSIWNTLRLVVGLLGNAELLPAVEKRLVFIFLKKNFNETYFLFSLQGS